ncbi:hypothetical protein [Salinactinospora qingdaonensis]|uniref:hypothetical protein n=1 Tax=Salinactinospora qingdaonensis TaxID=702744 RepID=UPI0031EC4A84
MSTESDSSQSAAAPAGDPARSGSPSPIRRMSLWPPPRSARHAHRRRKVALLTAVATVLVLVIVTGVVLLLPGSPPGESTGVPAAYAGSWSGEMSQEDEQGRHIVDWNAQLQLEAGAQRGTANWSSLDCRGSLKLTERGDDHLTLNYSETYDPAQHCIDTVTLTLRPGAAGDTLRAEWVATSHSGTLMTSTGTLR